MAIMWTQRKNAWRAVFSLRPPVLHSSDLARMKLEGADFRSW